MKKLFASIFATSLLLISSQAFAQLVPGAGYFFASEKTGNSDAVANHGFYVGTSYNIALGSGFGVAPGLYLDMLVHGQTAAAGSSIASAYLVGRYREFALNLPINLNYSLDFTDNLSLVIFAGPTFQLGLSSETTVTGEASFLGIRISDGEKFNHFNSDNGDRNRFNMSVGGGLGLHIGDLLFTVGYDRSLLDYTKDKNSTTARNMIKAGLNFAF